MLAGILYLIYTQDFPSYFHSKVNSPVEDLKSDEATVITFVDDTNSTIKEKINVDLKVTMKENLIQSEEYMSQNQLAINSKQN